MTDKPFDPVTEGTPVQFWQYFANADWQDREALIAARDAAMLERGRLKGLEEAAEAVEAVWATFPSYADRIKQSFLNAIRTAAETAKEGGDV